jgi:predicted RNA-binding Zn ribbon-like protein
MVADGVRESELVGGHAALDLVNTVSWRLDDGRRRDNLDNLTALLGWCQRADLVDAAKARELAEMSSLDDTLAQRVLHDVRDLREQLAATLELVTDTRGDGGVVIPPKLHAYLVNALSRADLTGSPARWALRVRQPGELPDLLAVLALDLLQSAELRRLRRCEGPGCGWLFLDRTRSNTRRWCSSSDCGNRDRARRHYARHHAKPAVAPVPARSSADRG